MPLRISQIVKAEEKVPDLLLSADTCLGRWRSLINWMTSEETRDTNQKRVNYRPACVTLSLIVIRAGVTRHRNRQEIQMCKFQFWSRRLKLAAMGSFQKMTPLMISQNEVTSFFSHLCFVLSLCFAL